MVSYGFLWSGEITVLSDAGYNSSIHLNMADISVGNAENPTVVKVKIKAAKTYQFIKGVDIYIGRTYNQICPVEALMAHVAVQGQEDGLLFHFKDNRLLTKGRFMARVREALTAAGINAKKFIGHSFHIGAATTAATKGVSAEKIQTLGQWESSAYLLYVRLSREELSPAS